MPKMFSQTFLDFIDENAEVFDDDNMLRDTWKNWSASDRLDAFKFFVVHLNECLFDALTPDLVEPMFGLFLGTGISGTLTYPGHLGIVPEDCFLGCKDLVKVILEKGINSIDDEAFEMSGVQEVIIPEGVNAIPRRCFMSCKNLEKVVLPNSISDIGDLAFNVCTSLKELVIPDNCTISKDSFCESGLEKVTLPKTLKIIPQHAFMDCKNLTQITIPDGVTRIDDLAFLNTGITTLEIPQSIKSLGKWIIGTDNNGDRYAMTKSHKIKVRGLAKAEAREWFENQVRTPSIAYHNLYLRKIV